MVLQSERFKAFVKLGTFLRSAAVGLHVEEDILNPSDPWQKELYKSAVLAAQENGWFTMQNIRHALATWGEALHEEQLHRWLSDYSIPKVHAKNVAVIMAGNIPLVGFHDFLTVLILGHSAQVKCASNDRQLLPLLAGYLISVEPKLKEAIFFTEGPLKKYDAVIATGSNNTSRYFQYYFGRKPHIIRKNRNSVAILEGDESPQELLALGADIFTYFGLGCRNVSKLFVPETYDFEIFFNAIEPFAEIATHRKYANNYDYNKAVYLMSEFPIMDNGFLLLKEDTSYGSPIGTLYFERYEQPESLQHRLETDRAQIQCMVRKRGTNLAIPFGTTQHPALWDYADGVDTVDFLLKT